MRTIIEPFRIKSVEALRMTSRGERRDILEKAEWNLFRIAARDVLIDLLTDSGNCAMSSDQWAGLMRGDESYAGSESWYRFEARVKELTGFDHVIPTHQGRAAERMLFSGLGVADRIVISNTHFDTTRANVEIAGGEALDLPCPELLQPDEEFPFKGNLDLEALAHRLAEKKDRIACVITTVTSDADGGQPVSMANLKSTAALCGAHGVPFYLDACRFAENAFLIKRRERGQGDRSVESIAQEMFRLAEGATFSAKNDGLANIGGFLGTRDDRLARQDDNLLIHSDGFPTYGGLAGRDLDAIAVGLQEVVQEDYLSYRVASVRSLGEGLLAAGLPIIRPPGGHAIYINAGSFLPHIPSKQLPAQALACAFYEEGGIRGVPIGSLTRNASEPGTGDEHRTEFEWLRLAVPRRVYTQNHINHVVEIAGKIATRAEEIRGLKIVEESPHLRPFTARLAPVEPSPR